MYVSVPGSPCLLINAIAFLMAVITNRTLLWKYYDRDACLGYEPTDHRGKQMRDCRIQNRKEDCDRVLTLKSEWLVQSSYDEFLSKIRRQRKEPPVTRSLPRNVALGDLFPLVYNRPDDNARSPSPSSSSSSEVHHYYREILSVDWYERLFLSKKAGVDIGGELLMGSNMSSDDDLGKTRRQEEVIEWSRNTARDLFSLGQSFAYGAAFHALFEFHQPEKYFEQKEKDANDSIANSSTLTTAVNTPFTIAVHSRHTDAIEDGCNVTRELDCIAQLLHRREQQQQQQQQSSCEVWVMSDRPCTVSQLQRQIPLAIRSCTVHAVNHTSCISLSNSGSEQQYGPHFHSDEHGPYAGAGYFADLAAASYGGSDAVVVGVQQDGSVRSSSALLLELIEYNRKMDAWTSGVDPGTLPDALRCQYESLTIKKQKWRQTNSKRSYSTVPE